MLRLGSDLFVGHLAGDPALIGDAGLEAIAEIKTQLAIALQESEAEHHLNLKLVEECDRLQQEVEDSSEYYWQAESEARADREYSKYLEKQLEAIVSQN